MRERNLLDSISQQKQGRRQPAMKVRNQMRTRVNILVDATKEKAIQIYVKGAARTFQKLTVPMVNLTSFLILCLNPRIF